MRIISISSAANRTGRKQLLSPHFNPEPGVGDYDILFVDFDIGHVINDNGVDFIYGWTEGTGFGERILQVWSGDFTVVLDLGLRTSWLYESLELAMSKSVLKPNWGKLFSNYHAWLQGGVSVHEYMTLFHPDPGFPDPISMVEQDQELWSVLNLWVTKAREQIKYEQFNRSAACNALAAFKLLSP